jgi:predicted alpha-1,6-mannanase (GH76 family)
MLKKLLLVACIVSVLSCEAQITVSNEAELRAISDNLQGSYILSNDIILTSEWKPVGSVSPFKGMFDGNNHIIYNLKIENSDMTDIGLFAATEGAVIKNLGMENASVIGDKTQELVNAGIFAGKAKNTTITDSYIRNSRLECSGNAGSFIGRIDYSEKLYSYISNCFSTTVIKVSSGSAGGITGTAENTQIENVYFAGYIESPSATSGGIIAVSNGNNTITNTLVASPHLTGNITGRIVGQRKTGVLTLKNNYARKDMLLGEDDLSKANPLPDAKSNLLGIHGENIPFTFPEYDFVYPHYTEEDINTALNAFNSCYLLTDKNIYRAGYRQNGVAAIWTQAIYLDIAMNAYRRTKNSAHKDLMYKIYKGNYEHYDRYNWDNGAVWFIYDDIMWWVISLARLYELTGDNEYLSFSKTGFERVWSGSIVVGDKGSYDPVNGGMFWAWNQQNPVGTPLPSMGKMACINYPAVIGAMSLYNATKEKIYFDRAVEIYSWSRNNLFDKKLGRVADSRHGNGNPAWKMHVYNQATCIGAAMMLYRETREIQYLDDAILAANYTKNQMGENGFLHFETGVEQGIYTAIFAQYIIRLIEDGEQYQYLSWLWHNMDFAWEHRTPENITYKKHASPAPSINSIESYDASGIPALMQVIPPSIEKEKEIDCKNRTFYEKTLRWNTKDIWQFPKDTLPVLKFTPVITEYTF